MGGGGGPTKTFTLAVTGSRSGPQGDLRVQGRVDKSNTFLADLEPGTANAADLLLHSIINNGGANIWDGTDLANPPSLTGVPIVDGGVNQTDMAVWDMSADGKFHIFGRGLGLGPDNAAGLVLARLGGTDLGVVQDATFSNTVGAGAVANKGIGKNVAIHPTELVAVAAGNFDVFPNGGADTGDSLDFVKYTLSETGAATQAAFPFSYGTLGATEEQGMGTSLDIGGNFAVIGPGGNTTGGFQHLAQLLDLNAGGWDDGANNIRARSFGFGSTEDGAGAVVRITDDGEHVLYTTSVPGVQAGSFRILKAAPGQVTDTMDVLATVPVSFVGTAAPGSLGDITNIDDENILVVLNVLNNDGTAGDGIVAYAGRPNDPQLITSVPIFVGDESPGTTISSIKITKAAPNSNFTDSTIKEPVPEENVIVTVTYVDGQGNPFSETYNLNN